MVTKRTDEPELDEPMFPVGAEEDVMLNFTDIDEMAGFEALPAGWYPLEIVGVKTNTITKTDGKLAPGTKGSQYEFAVMPGHEKAGRRVFNTYWHARSNLGFYKGLATISGQFTTDQLNAGINYDELQEGMIGGQVYGRLTVRRNEQYGDSNQLAQIKPYDGSMDSDIGDNLP